MLKCWIPSKVTVWMSNFEQFLKFYRIYNDCIHKSISANCMQKLMLTSSHAYLIVLMANDMYTYYVILGLIYCFPCIPVELSVQIVPGKKGKKYCMSRYLSCFMTWFMQCDWIDLKNYYYIHFFPAETFIIFIWLWTVSSTSCWIHQSLYWTRVVFTSQRKSSMKLSILEIKFYRLSVTGSIRIKNIVWIFKIDDTHWFD